MKNIGGDEPFGGDIPGPHVFSETDRTVNEGDLSGADGATGEAAEISTISLICQPEAASARPAYFETAPKDMVLTKTSASTEIDRAQRAQRARPGRSATQWV
ncbi:MAG TPA: hypothetical protein VJ978_12695 [Nitriliruptoraceae bacterium]|nr:hypothetical protein [Nitriliruptoraceae bacterium]